MRTNRFTLAHLGNPQMNNDFHGPLFGDPIALDAVEAARGQGLMISPTFEDVRAPVGF